MLSPTPIKFQLGAIITNGSIIYKESVRARSIIRLKQKILDEFPELKTRNDVAYQLEYHRTYPATLQRLNVLEKKGQAVPFLLFIYKNGDQNP